jgi:hypothetical protein
VKEFDQPNQMEFGEDTADVKSLEKEGDWVSLVTLCCETNHLCESEEELRYKIKTGRIFLGPNDEIMSQDTGARVINHFGAETLKWFLRNPGAFVQNDPAVSVRDIVTERVAENLAFVSDTENHPNNPRTGRQSRLRDAIEKGDVKEQRETVLDNEEATKRSQR